MPPANPVDELVLNFINDCRRRPQQESINSMLGPAAIDVRSMVGNVPQQLEWSRNSGQQQQHLPLPPPMAMTLARRPDTTGARHPIEGLVRSVLDLGGMKTLVERLAAFAHIQRYVAWLAHPTTITQARVGADYMPRARQLVRPHPIWVGLVRWGRLRDAIIDRQDLYATVEFQTIFGAHLRLVNWPPAGMSASAAANQLVVDPRTGHARLSSAFMEHAMNGDNWRMGKAFIRRYPELASLVELADDD
jgi:hypothetical protein